ncbi:GlsB/YeaQ/YmgE family stress response membrane protein [Streptosporangium lutulentum]|uniref:Membrane protein YeaQ/YmgE (Transglycosylase-associated protein family) n=1 Tax=Streptosporangium lutulentum TaxID=1461250 RepID=A0ABT9QKF7_9ACTN|nr:GlsB/YeaQ/YmgE family stress response membrane protein [Streptosporangium lutulentum]MDP9847245.1 putative membrane protein YeaQ/YmgE (transglycosylase-associated protein family) [Streptosporangium lutulentum]
MITFIFSAILVGAVTGGLGRLLIPGRQEIGLVATILAGIVAAFVGSGIAYLLDFEDNTWGVLILQLLLAVVCVGVVASRKKDEQSEV